MSQTRVHEMRFPLARTQAMAPSWEVHRYGILHVVTDLQGRLVAVAVNQETTGHFLVSHVAQDTRRFFVAWSGPLPRPGD